MKKKLPILVIVVLLVLGGVGYVTYAKISNSKPDDISQEIWDRGIQYTIYLNQLIENKETLDGNLASDLKEYVVTEKDNEIYIEMLKFEIQTALYGISLMFGGESTESKDNYLEAYKNVEKIFGKNNLKPKNLDMAFIENTQLNNLVKLESERKELEQDFMRSNGVTLTAKEVQYNMSNNLDKEFYIAGEVKLCDYYNYGYTNESSFFCGELTPFDGSYSDSWYLYFHRDSFEKYYNALLEGNLDLHVVAQINSKSYKSSQGNMAMVRKLLPYE